MDKMTNQVKRAPGKTTIAPEVLLTIIQLATLDIPGVSRMAPISGSIRWRSKRQEMEGVRLEVIDERVYTDIYVILKHDVNARETSRNIQREVSRSISKMVGMELGRVNIHIEDIDYPSQVKAEE
jgi:uncharacterized alkaline shock family protein YloU